MLCSEESQRFSRVFSRAALTVSVLPLPTLGFSHDKTGQVGIPARLHWQALANRSQALV